MINRPFGASRFSLAEWIIAYRFYPTISRFCSLRPKSSGGS